MSVGLGPGPATKSAWAIGRASDPVLCGPVLWPCGPVLCPVALSYVLWPFLMSYSPVLWPCPMLDLTMAYVQLPMRYGRFNAITAMHFHHFVWDVKRVIWLRSPTLFLSRLI